MVGFFRARKKENVCLVVGRTRSRAEMGRHKGGMQMGAKGGKTHDVSGEVGEARGSATSVFVARKEMELLEKQQRQTEEEGKFLHIRRVFLVQ